MVGCFSNTVLVRADLNSLMFREALCSIVVEAWSLLLNELEFAEGISENSKLYMGTRHIVSLSF